MSISRRGLLAIGLTAAVVGSIGVASMLNANADDGTDGASPADSPSAVAESAAPAAPGTLVRTADGTMALTPPDSALPRTERSRRLRVGPVGATSAQLTRLGASAASDDNSDTVRPEFGPKGRNGRNGRPLAVEETTVVPPPLPPLSPVLRGDPVSSPIDDAYFLYARGTYGSDKNPLGATGASAMVTIGKPYLDKLDWHSLGEIAVQSVGGGDTIEVGWTVDRGVNHLNDDPHLFVFNWVDGAPGCYNGCGFYPVDGALIKPGDTLPAGVTKAFSIKHIGSAWYVGYDGNFFGGFVDDQWGQKFTQFDQVQYFGEVAASSLTPCTQMGSATTASLAAGSRFSSISLVGGPTDAKGNAIPQGLNVQSLPTVDPRDNVTKIDPFYPVVGVSDNLFRYGGNGISKCTGNPPPLLAGS